MQLYTFASILVCATAITQAMPLVDSAAVSGLTTISAKNDVGSPRSIDTLNNHVESRDIDIKQLVSRDLVSEVGRIISGQVKDLVSGALLTVLNVQISGSGVPAPQINGQIADQVKILAKLAQESSLVQRVGEQFWNTNYIGTLAATWNPGAGTDLVPFMSRKEWEVLFLAMYRALSAQSSLGDYVTVAFDIGGRPLTLALGLLN